MPLSSSSSSLQSMNRTPYSFLFKVPMTCLALNSYTMVQKFLVFFAHGQSDLWQRSLFENHFLWNIIHKFPNRFFQMLTMWSWKHHLTSLHLLSPPYNVWSQLHRVTLRIKLIVHLRTQNRTQQLVSQKMFTIPISPSDNAHLAHILPKRFKTIHLNLWRI